MLQLIVAIFEDQGGATRALDTLLPARERVADGVLEAVAVTRSSGGEVLVQRTAEPVAQDGFAVSAVMARVLALLDTTRRRPGHPQGPDAAWKATRRLLVLALRPAADALTPATSALLTIVVPAGAAEVVGAVLDNASLLAAEDLPVAAIASFAGDPALLFAGPGGAASLQGYLPFPHTAFMPYRSGLTPPVSPR